MATKKSIRKIPVSEPAEKPVKSGKKPVKSSKKSERLALDAFTVSQAELAAILGIATSNVTPMVQAGLMTKDSDGRFNLRDSVSGYCKRMRERRGGGGDSRAELEVQNLALKNEKLKEGLRSWRMQRDREVAMAILEAQRSAMEKLREECKLVPQLVSVIDGMLECISRIDVEDISYRVEGEEDADDEE